MVVVADKAGLDPKLLSMPPLYQVPFTQEFMESVLVPHGLIEDRIKKIAFDIREAYGDRTITMLVILRVLITQGAFRYAKDLVDAMDKLQYSRTTYRPYDLEFIRVRSYTNDQQTGVTISGLDIATLRGKDVLIVEDMIDSGKTMQMLLETLGAVGCASLKVTTLVVKRNPLGSGYMPDFVGFSLPNDWIVGYHTDYNDVSCISDLPRFRAYLRS